MKQQIANEYREGARRMGYLVDADADVSAHPCGDFGGRWVTVWKSAVIFVAHKEVA